MQAATNHGDRGRDMTQHRNDEDARDNPHGFHGLFENAELPEEEPNHPGWLSIGHILKVEHPVFENSRFLIGYHHSSNVYVLAGSYLTLVDPGNDYTIFAELEKLGYSPLDIRKIVLTHGHRDHCMGVFELLRYPPIMEGKGIEILMHAGGPAEFKQMVTEVGFPPTELKGGEVVDLSGFPWEVIHTPGHTIDGICLYHEPTRTVITGDTVLPESIGDADKSAGGQLDHYLHGLKQLLRRDIAHVLPGHGVPVAMTGRRAVEETYEGVMMKIIEVPEDGRMTWMEGARLLAGRGLLEEVVYCCDKELLLRPENPPALQLKALALNDMGRCAEAMDILDRILIRQPDDAHVLTARGQALLGMGRHEDSLPCFDKALALSPDLTEARIFKGMALFFLGRHAEAMAIDVFKSEFLARFKTEVDQGARQRQGGGPGQTT
jgi:glyoxylase-like metal-dependent hydrolase (beta-lactamase superfamily II)